MTNEQYKALSIKEFDKAARKYESGHAGIYELCKKDYPPILEELEKEPFETLLDCGCGTGPMISLLAERYPDMKADTFFTAWFNFKFNRGCKHQPRTLHFKTRFYRLHLKISRNLLINVDIFYIFVP